MKEIKSIHFVGIKGVGMTPLAIIAKEAGMLVTGSDVEEEFITDETLRKTGIFPFKNFSSDHVGNVDVVVTTGAHGGFENVEVVKAKELGIPVWTHGQALGEFMKGKILGRSLNGVSIAGTHGKTTTTSLLATVFKESGLDPSYIVGTSELIPLGLPGHLGKGNMFIAEADEYATEPKYDKSPRFLWQYPQTLVITNIDHDHPDIYPTLNDVKSAFSKLLENVSGTIIACGDDNNVLDVIKQSKVPVITYGINSTNDYQLISPTVTDLGTTFRVKTKKLDLGEFTLQILGEHNALNALAVIAVSLEQGISLEYIKKGLVSFKGSKRRLEFKGELENGSLVYDDYAHHPTELKKTLETLRSAYPTGNIIGIFQPHTYSRTKKLFEQFSNSFTAINTIIVVPIYASARETIDESISSELLVQEIQSRNINAIFVPEMLNVVEYINQNDKKDTIFVAMGAGDIYKITESLQFI